MRKKKKYLDEKPEEPMKIILQDTKFNRFIMRFNKYLENRFSIESDTERPVDTRKHDGRFLIMRNLSPSISRNDLLRPGQSSQPVRKKVEAECPVLEDAISAMLNMGYKKTEAKAAIEKAISAKGRDADLVSIIAEALRK